jgi:hypothetical protein
VENHSGADEKFGKRWDLLFSQFKAHKAIKIKRKSTKRKILFTKQTEWA